MTQDNQQNPPLEVLQEHNHSHDPSLHSPPRNQHNNQPFTPSPADDDSQNQIQYYDEFCKLYLANSILHAQLRQLKKEREELQMKLAKVQTKAESTPPHHSQSQNYNNPQNFAINNENEVSNNTNEESKKKRVRRTASEISRHYKCQVENCHKSYGSEGSLNQHIKLKHPELAMSNSVPYQVEEKVEEQELSIKEQDQQQEESSQGEESNKAVMEDPHQ